ncbi:hypothetical protein NLJ89_g9081 [Agrocybe chaxingu]|uniref:Uncharacterized protein n=1 Tax=Agrocybe chaxingu TaxID=84603 RepID=A0A9W8MTG8_9AGAR|nr:hypothetical protein NLJ89_g9081 [Agrocybe chaxingu]
MSVRPGKNARGRPPKTTLPPANPTPTPSTSGSSNQPLPTPSQSDPTTAPASVPPQDGPGKTLEDFFQYANMPHFEITRPPSPSKQTTHTTSKRTREPRFFDMHLHKSLRLKKIVLLEKLPQALGELCDSMATSSSYEISRRILPPPLTRIINEDSLVRYYQTQRSPLYAEVASQLAFGIGGPGNTIFNWRKTQDGDSRKHNEALADGFLRLDIGDRGEIADEHRRSIALLSHHGLSHLAIWEFKSLACGPGIMAQIPNHAGDFTWTACQERTEGDEASICCGAALVKHRTNGRRTVTGRRPGPDAQNQSILHRATHLSERKRRQHSAENTEAKRPHLSDENATAKRAASFVDDMGLLNVVLEARHPQVHGVPEFATKGEQSDYGKAHDVLQQTWTQAVVDDVTYFMFSSGNEEYIGYRQRETQTLYLSALIIPSQAARPAHGKLHVGLYIAAFQDALDRARQMQILKDATSSSPAASSIVLDKGPLVTKQTSVDQELDKELLRLFNETSSIFLRLHRHNITPCSNPNTWTLSRQIKDSEQTSTGTHPELFIDLDHKISDKVFVAFLGRSTPNNSPQQEYHSKQFIFKIACLKTEITTLQTEYQNYMDLSKHGLACIQKPQGLFSSQVRSGKVVWLLLMNNGGTSLAVRKNGRMKFESHLDVHEDSYINALRSLHGKFYTHNRLEYGHILMDVKAEKVTFISLASCSSYTDAQNLSFQEEKNDDKVTLLECLKTNAEVTIKQPNESAGKEEEEEEEDE